MNQPVLILFAASLFASLFALAWRTRRAAGLRKRSRRSYFDRCAPLLAQCHSGPGAAGFSRMTGQYRGSPVDLQAVPDTLTFRKLPALWVLVTIPAPVPVRATLDLMLRPTGLESFSGFARLPYEVAVPAGFPANGVLRSDYPQSLVPAEALRPHLALFDNPRVKELVISPKGLRVVFLAEEGDRSRYLLFRDAEMGQSALKPEQVAPLLDRLLAIGAELERTQLAPQGADAA